MNATETVRTIREDAERIKNDETQRFPEAATDGDTFRQGDLYLTFRDRVPVGAATIKSPSSQLAPGTTQGSRHVLDSLDGVTAYAKPNATALDGPVLRLREERTVTHPEHGDVVLPPGVYEVTYQRLFSDDLRRVQD